MKRLAVAISDVFEPRWPVVTIIILRTDPFFTFMCGYSRHHPPLQDHGKIHDGQPMSSGATFPFLICPPCVSPAMYAEVTFSSDRIFFFPPHFHFILFCTESVNFPGPTIHIVFQFFPSYLILHSSC
ncbi:unnamed protein product, partial [Sphacelaria rigidula]